MTVKPAMKARRALLASLLVGSAAVSSGCTSGGMSLASVNPFSKPSSATVAEPPGISATLASAATGAGKQVSSAGTSAKNAWSKTTGAVAGIFKSDSNADLEVDVTDPLSLANRPEKIGAEVFVANGQLWESTGDFNKAMESYEKALEVETSDAPALTSIARLHFRQGNHLQAAEYFQQAITQKPTDAGLHNDLGLTLNKMGKRTEASASLQKALELAPGTSRYANNLASVKYEAGDAEGAYQVLSGGNKPAVAHFNMAYLHFKGGQMTKAREHLGQVMEYQPQAAADPAIQRAVERSRDMIAQISAATGPVAQAAPQATIATGGAYYGPTQPGKQVQQTSQSESTPSGGVSPAGSVAPTMSVPMTKPAVSVPSTEATGKSLPPAAYSAMPTSQAAPPVAPAAPAATRPMPTRPTMSGASEAPSDAATKPSVPFSMPTGFGTP